MFNISELLQQFVEENIELIDDREFDTLYDRTVMFHDKPVNRAQLTELLEYTGIDPLEYLEVVPASYLRASRTSHPQVHIPSSVTAIEGSAFIKTDIQKLVIDEGCTQILAHAFSMCSELVSVSLPRSLTYIGRAAFNCCEELKKIHYNGTIEDWNNMNRDRSWFTYNPQYHTDLEILCSDGSIFAFPQGEDSYDDT